MKLILGVSIFIFGILASHSGFAKEDTAGIFSGRVSKINVEGGLVRVRAQFDNVRYLNKRDKVSFWDVHHPLIRCNAYVVGKSNEYFMMRVPDYKSCLIGVTLGLGRYLQFYSQDLANNIAMGRELVDILLKKRVAIQGKVSRNQKELDSFTEKVNAVNERYKLLREKLEAEWREELGLIEDDRLVALRNFKDLQMRLDEIDLKLQKYKIEDENLVTDRWSLDPRLFYKK
ncbi:MAG: hypothetical protein HYV97_19865 [Bdellovibrio sp.]|nr:hypothetical protein [Bdellovibrio sp.]